MPYWAYVNSCRNFGGDDDFTVSDMRWHVMTAMLAQPEGTTCWDPGAGGDSWIFGLEASRAAVSQDLLIGFFTDDAGERYVMLQNPNHTHGDMPTNTTGEARSSSIA